MATNPLDDSADGFWRAAGLSSNSVRFRPVCQTAAGKKSLGEKKCIHHTSVASIACKVSSENHKKQHYFTFLKLWCPRMFVCAELHITLCCNFFSIRTFRSTEDQQDHDGKKTSKPVRTLFETGICSELVQPPDVSSM